MYNKSDISCFDTDDGGFSVVPERDSASLKQIRYGPSHEKFPSWPNPSKEFGSDVNYTGDLNGFSSRSKSWTPETDYPKEKPAPCARPFMKRANAAYSQQLKTVMENCEKILPETYENRENGEFGYRNLLPPPCGYRDMSYIEKNLVSNTDPLNNGRHDGLSSPPERDIPTQDKPFNQNELDFYTKKYEERSMGYANSEGYHSYISSECSSVIGSGTPFMDQLRRHSEPNHSHWYDDTSPRNTDTSPDSLTAINTSGRESVATVVTNNSSNSSGTENIHYVTPISPINMSISGGPSISTNSRIWEDKLQQSMTQSNDYHSLSSENEDKGPESRICNSNINLKKFPLSTYTRPNTLPLSDEPIISKENGHSPSKNSSDQSPDKISPIIDTSQPPSVAKRIIELEQQSLQKSIQPPPPLSTKSSLKESFRRLSFRVSGNKAQPQQQSQSRVKSTISPIEKEEWAPQKEKEIVPNYTFLDPDKKHKVADVTLKAIQKKALLAYYERHAGKTGVSFSQNTVPLRRKESFNTGNKTSATQTSPKDILMTSEDSLVLPEYPKLSPPNLNNTSSSQSIQARCFEFNDTSAEFLTSFQNHDLQKTQQGIVRKSELNGGVDKLGYYNLRSNSNITSAQTESNIKYLPNLSRDSIPISSNLSSTRMSQSSRSLYDGSQEFSSINSKQLVTPPERPPKKPHLKNICHDNTEKSDPNTSHYVPYSHFRSPPPVPNANAVPQSPPPLPLKSTQNTVRQAYTSPNLPPPPPQHMSDDTTIADDPLPPPPSPQVLSLMNTRSYSSSQILHQEPLFSSSLIEAPTLSHAKISTYPESDTSVSVSPSKSGLKKYESIQKPITNVISSSKDHKDGTGWMDSKVMKHKQPRPLPFKRSVSSDTKLFNNNSMVNENSSSTLPPIAQVAPLRARGGYFAAQPYKSYGTSKVNFKYENRSESLKKDYKFSNGISDVSIESENGALQLQSNEQQMAMVSPLRIDNDGESRRVNDKEHAQQESKKDSNKNIKSLEDTTTRIRFDDSYKTYKNDLSIRKEKGSTASGSHNTNESHCNDAQQEYKHNKVKTFPNEAEMLLKGLTHHDLHCIAPFSEIKRSGKEDEKTVLSDCETEIDRTMDTLIPNELPSCISESIQTKSLMPISADSPYFTTSECKAKFLTQYSNNMEDYSKYKKENNDLKKQKDELLSRISRKLEILKIEQSEVSDEIKSNELLGRAIIEKVKNTAKENEFQKFKLHVEEIERITSLLLGLSGRLARAENALMVFQGRSPNSPEKDILTSKRDRIKEQFAEAMLIKQSIDRRSKQITELLEVYLTADQLEDYHHFAKMKAKLITDAKDLDEKIMLGEEQMQALKGL